MQPQCPPESESVPILDTRGPDPHPAGAEGVELTVDGEQAVEWLVGDIDVANAEHVLALGSVALAETYVVALVVDLSQVTFLGSTGLGALVQLLNHARAAGKRLALRGVPPAAAKVLAITGLDSVFGLIDGDAGCC